MTNQELIEKAAAVVRPKKIGDYTVGDVGCALLTDRDYLYAGVCIDTRSSMGFCAEHNAIGAMVTAGEYRIKKIVGVWKDDKGEIYVVAPCGRCREFMYQIDKGNLETEVILGKNKTAKLSELLPYPDWYNKD
jgi:cytidine deaminase